MNTPELEELKALVAQKYGRSLQTTTDFEEFSVRLKKWQGKTVSASTLKRMWGYVSDSHKPRVFTLDVLSQFLGHENYTAFLKWLKTSTKYNSSFFDAKQVVSNELAVNDIVEIGWSPNRLLHLKYLGDSRYEVQDSVNSKLIAGDVFITGCFIKEQPLYVPYVIRDGDRTAPFVAGRNGGLTIINVLGAKR